MTPGIRHPVPSIGYFINRCKDFKQLYTTAPHKESIPKYDEDILAYGYSDKDNIKYPIQIDSIDDINLKCIVVLRYNISTGLGYLSAIIKSDAPLENNIVFDEGELNSATYNKLVYDLTHKLDQLHSEAHILRKRMIESALR